MSNYLHGANVQSCGLCRAKMAGQKELQQHLKGKLHHHNLREREKAKPRLMMNAPGRQQRPGHRRAWVAQPKTDKRGRPRGNRGRGSVARHHARLAATAAAQGRRMGGAATTPFVPAAVAAAAPAAPAAVAPLPFQLQLDGVPTVGSLGTLAMFQQATAAQRAAIQQQHARDDLLDQLDIPRLNRTRSAPPKFGGRRRRRTRRRRGRTRRRRRRTRRRRRKTRRRRRRK